MEQCCCFKLQLNHLIFNLLQVDRVKTVVSEGVREIWLSSEDTGAYGNLDVQFFLGF